MKYNFIIIVFFIFTEHIYAAAETADAFFMIIGSILGSAFLLFFFFDFIIERIFYKKNIEVVPINIKLFFIQIGGLIVRFLFSLVFGVMFGEKISNWIVNYIHWSEYNIFNSFIWGFLISFSCAYFAIRIFIYFFKKIISLWYNH